MKKLYSLVAVVVLMSGCSYKNEPIELSSYKAQYLGQMTQDTNSVSLLSVTDIREDKRSIGHVEANGQVTTKLYSYVDFANRYKEGLEYALKAAKINLTKNPADSDTTISVKIKDIQIVYNDTEKFDENLHGKIVVDVMIKKADKTIVQTVTQQEGKWIKPSYTSKDIEPLMYSLFTDSINLIVSKLAAQ
jgi:uncharacterized lipoprotein